MHLIVLAKKVVDQSLSLQSSRFSLTYEIFHNENNKMNGCTADKLLSLKSCKLQIIERVWQFVWMRITKLERDLERLTLLYFVVQQRTDKTHLLVVESLESPLSIHNRKEPEERRWQKPAWLMDCDRLEPKSSQWFPSRAFDLLLKDVWLNGSELFFSYSFSDFCKPQRRHPNHYRVTNERSTSSVAVKNRSSATKAPPGISSKIIPPTLFSKLEQERNWLCAHNSQQSNSIILIDSKLNV